MENFFKTYVFLENFAKILRYPPPNSLIANLRDNTEVASIDLTY